VWFCFSLKLSNHEASLFSLNYSPLASIRFSGLFCTTKLPLYIPHPVGTVIGATKIGHNATILQGVTLGAKEIDISYLPANRPTIGDNVTIGAGAKVLGGINIGDNVTIGANAVVTKSLPDNVVAAGVPAKIIRTGDKL
jgi:serine O-acetyltransferase